MNVALPADTLDLISLCTGGGGLDLGVELAIPSARSRVMVEREGFAVAHLVAAIEQGLLAPAAIWSDVRTFNGRPWRGLVDGLIGGIPCQPHSLAGRKQGSLDKRDLWSDARRIIVQSGCWFVLIENVAGMLAAGADEVAGAERVWRDLRKLGFAVEGGLFTASEVGATHQRERIFILGVADPIGDADRRTDVSRGLQGPSSTPEGEAWQSDRQRSRARSSNGGQAMADAGGARLQGRELGRSSGERHGPPASRPAAELRRAHLVDAPLVGRNQAFGAGGTTIAGAGVAMLDHGIGEQGDLGRDEPQELAAQRGERPLVDPHHESPSEIGESHASARRGRGEQPTGHRAAGGGHHVDDAPGERGGAVHEGQRRSGQAAAIADRPGLFPPGPGEIDRWRDTLARAPELEPAVRRVADGLGAPLGSRVDELRLLGNGVVPLEAAHALRTLVARLAERGAAGADQLVRMMVQP